MSADHPAAKPLSRLSSRKRRKLKEKQRTFSIAALCDLRDTVDAFLDGDSSIQDLGAALDRAYKVPRV